jgi:outer membrane protein TolC
MRTLILSPLLFCAIACAEVHSLTLPQALALAGKQAPEVLLSRIEEQKAQQNVQIARDPFVPKVVAGSGLAYTSGFPMSIEGSAPSIIQARAVGSVYNLPQKYALARAREESRGAALEGQDRREKAYAQTASMFLDAEKAARLAETARRLIESAEKMEMVVRARVAEGRELPIESKRAALALARARQRAGSLDADRDFAEESLAMILGFAPGDRVRTVADERSALSLPSTPDAAVEQALKDNAEIRRLESALLARNLDAKSYQAERWPKLDLVAQYGLFSRFNNYEDYFARFSRHNGQIGVSIQLPLLVGPAASAQAQSADAEAARLRIEVNRARARIALETRRAFQQVEQAESSRQVARLDLEVARDNLSLLLERMEEGRATLQQVEQARVAENEKWLVYYEAQYTLERARIALLDRTGNLMAALRLP